MHSILLVSSSEKGVQAIKKLIDGTEFAPVSVASSAAEARRLLAKMQPDLCIVNCPLSDEFGTELGFDISKNYLCGVVLVVRAELVDTISQTAGRVGILTEKKPFDAESFLYSLTFLGGVGDKYRTIVDENNKLRAKLDEIKLVNRAKRVLMDCLKMGEPQAHRYIEKQAMDLRITRREVAETIIKTYTDSY